MNKAAPLFGIVLLSLLCGCGKSEEAFAKRELFVMDTYMTMTAYGQNSEAALDRVCSKITELEELFSVTEKNSDIARINSSCGKAVKVSGDTLRIISRSAELSEMTGGAFDITVYPLVREWGFTTGNYSVPTRDRINELLRFTGISRVSADNDKVNVPENFQLDLGAVAKGYAGDSATAILREEGVSSAILSLGGNIQTVGSKPDGTSWRVAVADPHSPEDTICTISVIDKAVVTSGNYQRYFLSDDGEKYCHIIDPKTGYPVRNGLSSVTVTGDIGTECDALSTALFVMGEEKAISFWSERRNFELLMITEDGRIILTEGLKDDIIFADSTLGQKTEVIE